MTGHELIPRDETRLERIGGRILAWLIGLPVLYALAVVMIADR